MPVADYLADRLGGILRLVPRAREAHLRLDAFERMLDDGVADAAELFHREGLRLDVWTLDAWHARLARTPCTSPRRGRGRGDDQYSGRIGDHRKRWWYEKHIPLVAR
jgi:hypothetical protein